MTRRTELLRIRHGVYAPLSWWRSLDDEARLRQMHHAMALRAATPPVIRHASAALRHGLHLLRAPAAPHVVSAPGRGSRNNRTCVHHWAHLPPEHVVQVDGLLATSVPRTVLDCAATLPVREALVIADHALHRGTERTGCCSSSTDTRSTSITARQNGQFSRSAGGRKSSRTPGGGCCAPTGRPSPGGPSDSWISCGRNWPAAPGAGRPRDPREPV